VREGAERQCAKRLSPRSCLRYLHRLGFVWKRPKRLLLKTDAAKRAAMFRDVLAWREKRESAGFDVRKTFKQRGDGRKIDVLDEASGRVVAEPMRGGRVAHRRDGPAPPAGCGCRGG